MKPGCLGPSAKRPGLSLFFLLSAARTPNPSLTESRLSFCDFGIDPHADLRMFRAQRCADVIAKKVFNIRNDS